MSTIEKEEVRAIKPFMIFCLAILLVSCSTSGNSKEQEEHSKMKEVTLKIIGGEEKEYYLIEISTKGGQSDNNSAVLPQGRLVMTNEEKEATIKLHIDIPYTIHVSKSKVKTVDEFMAKKTSGEVVTGPLLKTIEFTPRQDTSTLEIRLDNDHNE